jgi:CrcB protein
MAIVAVLLGGALGSVLRYLVSGWVQAWSGGLFPLGTLTVNIGGSFVIGLALGLGAGRFLVSPEWRLFLTTGFCGGFTTFSTFSYETLALIEDRQWLPAAGNVALNLALCGAATFAGLSAARAL